MEKDLALKIAIGYQELYYINYNKTNRPTTVFQIVARHNENHRMKVKEESGHSSWSSTRRKQTT